MNSTKFAGRTLTLFALMLTLLCQSCHKRPPVDPGIELEEYRVMSAALKFLKFKRTEQMNKPFMGFRNSSGSPDTGVTVYPSRYPKEFPFARDTARARIVYNYMTQVYGAPVYYLTIFANTLSQEWDLLWFCGDSLEMKDWPEIERSFCTRNQKSYKLNPALFSDSLIVRLIGEDEFHERDEFRSSLPLSDGRIRISRVGFSTDRTEALIVHSRRSGPGGTDLLMRLRKSAVDWQVVENEELRDVTGGW